MKTKQIIIYTSIIALAIIAIVVGYFFVTNTTVDVETSSTFKFSSQGGKTPTFSRATVDPSDVKVGDIQTISVEVSDPDGVASVFAITELDSHTKRLGLHPINADSPCTDCIWENSWEVNDTSNKTYITTLEAENTKGDKHSVTISWTDPCSPPQSGAWSLDGNCSISTTNGLEEGVFTIPEAYTLTMQSGGTWVYQAGYPISIIGTIAIQSGGQLVRSLLWVADVDGDGYAPSTAQVASDTQPTNYIRKKNATGFDDCYDSNANAKPSQTAYFSTHRGDSSYDYNCDTVETKLYNSNGSCSCGKEGCSGNVGWAGSVAACGVSATYYTNTSCDSESRTQTCR